MNSGLAPATTALAQDLLALAKGGQNITSQVPFGSMYLRVSSCGVWYLSLRYPAYEDAANSDQASGPPLTRILSVGTGRKHMRSCKSIIAVVHLDRQIKVF